MSLIPIKSRRCGYRYYCGLTALCGLNSLYLGYIDYDSGSIAFAMTCGFWLIFKYLPRLL